MFTLQNAMLAALAAVASTLEPSCVVHGMAYTQENMAKTPNGAFLATAAACQSSCSVNVFCNYFTWYNDSTACWLFGNQATLLAQPNATSGPRSCTGTTPPTGAPTAVPGATVAPSATVAPTVSEPTPEEVKEVSKKVAGLATVIKGKTKDPKVKEEADKVIAASKVGTLPEMETVYAVLNEASAVVPLEEAEKEGVAVTVDDLDIIARENHLGGIEGAEEGVSYGVGAPWTDAIIPYCFRVGIGRTSIENARSAIQLLQQMVPGIHWKMVGSKGEACEESPSLLVTDTEPGCFADIGMQSQFFGGSQKLNIPPMCSVGVVLHELLHVLGMGHEQSRPDRDQYVRVMWQNIKSGMESQFSVMGNADTNRPYDVTSIMHYGTTAFTKNGMPTLLLTPQGQALLRSGSRIGQRESLSQMDFEQLIHLYNCERDYSGRYSVCNPRAQTSLVVILVAVFGAVAVLGCCAFGAYWYACRGKRRGSGLKVAHTGHDRRPLIVHGR